MEADKGCLKRLSKNGIVDISIGYAEFFKSTKSLRQATFISSLEYVDPKYTSQICHDCGTRNKAKDRKYKCSCGYYTHRDRVGAINIMNAPVVDGNSLSA